MLTLQPRKVMFKVMATSNIHEEIVIKNPSEKLMDLVQRMREHKRIRREENKVSKPLFTLHA